MKKSFALLLVLMLVMSAALAGCQTKTETPAPTTETPAATTEPAPAETTETPATTGDGFIRHNLGANPQTLDPALNTAVDGAIVLVNLFEGLAQVDKDNQILPGIAEKWDISDDMLTYTFHLRDSKWSDGKALTAKDFEYAWKRALDPATAAEYAYQMYYIEGAQAFNEGTGSKDAVAVKAVDDKTLEVKLASPTPYFLSLTAFPTYFPVREDLVTADPEQWALKAESFISNGPFKFVKWEQNNEIEIVPNENYWDASKVKLAGVKFVMINEAATALSAYQAGEIDYNETIPQEQIPTLQANDPTFGIYPYIGTYFYVFNVESAPFDNVKVREAFAKAIDRTVIVENVAQGGQKPALGFVPYGMQLSDKKEFRDAAPDYGLKEVADPEGAKAALAAAGFPDGAGLPPVEFVYNTSEGHKAIAEAVQEMWKNNLGVEVSIRNEEWAVFQDTRQNGDFQVARHGWIGDYTDPMTFLDMWYSTSGNNDCQWNNKEFDAAIDNSKKTQGAERDQHMLNAEKIMFDNWIVAPIYYYTKPALISDKIQGAVMSPLGFVYYKDATYN